MGLLLLLLETMIWIPVEVYRHLLLRDNLLSCVQCNAIIHFQVDISHLQYFIFPFNGMFVPVLSQDWDAFTFPISYVLDASKVRYTFLGYIPINRYGYKCCYSWSMHDLVAHISYMIVFHSSFCSVLGKLFFRWWYEWMSQDDNTLKVLMSLKSIPSRVYV